MCFFPARAGRRVVGVSFADPDAGAAYRSFAEAIAIVAEPGAPPHLRALARAALDAYARALQTREVRRRRVAWGSFIQCAALLYFAVTRQRERRADPRWPRAAQTLREIVLENADLMPNSPRAERVQARALPVGIGQPHRTVVHAPAFR